MNDLRDKYDIIIKCEDSDDETYSLTIIVNYELARFNTVVLGANVDDYVTSRYVIQLVNETKLYIGWGIITLYIQRGVNKIIVNKEYFDEWLGVFKNKLESIPYKTIIIKT